MTVIMEYVEENEKKKSRRLSRYFEDGSVDVARYSPNLIRDEIIGCERGQENFHFRCSADRK